LPPHSPASIDGFILLDSIVNYKVYPVTEPTSFNSIFTGIDTTGFNIIGSTLYVGQGVGFIGGNDLINPNTAYLIRIPISKIGLRLNYTLEYVQNELLILDSIVNYKIYPVTSPTSFNSIFTGIDTTGFTIIGSTLYVGQGSGFIGGNDLIDPNTAYLIRIPNNRVPLSLNYTIPSN
tara:strand:- start:384 stop:914 length:531 start_codon:yes stop_codon:yes gene_type:complete